MNLLRQHAFRSHRAGRRSRSGVGVMILGIKFAAIMLALAAATVAGILQVVPSEVPALRRPPEEAP
jgi:hypothetical protein